LEWGCQNRPKSTIPGHFFEIFEIFGGEKWPHITKLNFFIYLTFYTFIKKNKFGWVKSFQKCTDWEITSFAKISKSGKRGENEKMVISRFLQFLTGVSDFKYGSFYEFLIILLSMPHIKLSLFADIFSSVVDWSWHFNKISLVEKMHKWGKSGFFKKP